MRKNRFRIVLLGLSAIFIFASLILTILAVKNKTSLHSRASASRLVYAIGDSITAGFTNFTNWTVFNPSLNMVPDTFLSVYANQNSSQFSSFINLGYAGTTAACAYTCPTSDLPNYASNAKSSYINNFTSLPNNQGPLQTLPNLVNRSAPGLARSNLGQFDSIKNSEVILAYGRNDVDNAGISLDQFYQAENSLVTRLQINYNSVDLFTVPPMTQSGWSKYASYSTRRHEFDNQIYDQNYPLELDSFFSAKVWEIAYNTKSYIVPVHEFFYTHPDQLANYISPDQVHPGKSGHQILANLINNKSPVYKNSLSVVQVNDKFVITGSSGYGMVVYYSDNGSFYYSEPFQSGPNLIYMGQKLSNQAYVYSTIPLTISPVVIDTRAQFTSGSNLIDSVTAYGRGYNWNTERNNIPHPWPNNGFDLMSVSRFASGPCAGRPSYGCKLDTRSQFNVNGTFIESITAYGRGYNFNPNGSAWPGNGFDLNSVSRFASGPCAGQPSFSCKFDARSQFKIGGVLKEVINAYGHTWVM